MERPELAAAAVLEPEAKTEGSVSFSGPKISVALNRFTAQEHLRTSRCFSAAAEAAAAETHRLVYRLPGPWQVTELAQCCGEKMTN